ncbi:hypothetical protein GCM10023162_40440 [Klenkia terrae]
MNVGPELFADPVRADPHTFLHELVHTCQVHHASSRRAFTSAAVVTQVRHSLGRDAYAYDLPVRPLAAYGMEQQAQLAADWWRGRPGRWSGWASSPRRRRAGCSGTPSAR